MKSFDAGLEVQLIKTIVDTDKSILILARINAEYFGSAEAREVYKRILIFINAGKNIPTSDSLKNDQALSEPARMMLSNRNITYLTNDADLENTFEILNKYRIARTLYNFISISLESLKEDNPNINDTLSNMEKTIQACYSGDSAKSEMLHMHTDNAVDIVTETTEELRRQDLDYITTGFTEFDNKSGGFRKKNVITIASVPGGGKSAMALQMAANQYLKGYNVCLVSFEMDEIEIKYRLLASISRVDHTLINLKKLTAKHIEIIGNRFYEFLKASDKGNRFTIWTPKREMSMSEIGMELKPYNYDIVYVDYISLLKADPKKAMWEVLGDHTRIAKIYAAILNAAIVLLAQYDDEGNKIKYSKAIVANSNFVWAWDNSKKEQESGIVEIKQLKARNAPVYSFYLQRDMSIMKFNDYNGPPPIDNEPEEKKEKRLPKMPELK